MRDASDWSERQDWGRFDIVGQTLYLADSVDAAFRESLAPFRQKLIDTGTSFDKAARALGVSTEEFAVELRKEWDQLGHMAPGSVPASWRKKRCRYEVVIDAPGWWIDISDACTMSVLNKWAVEQRLGRVLTLSDVTGEDRTITTPIAQYLSSLVLDDYSAAMGLSYLSKHGSSRCFAYWVRPTEKGSAACVDTQTIKENDPSYKSTAELFGLGPIF
ncbi:hypothetical protein [Kocuria flava]|uniref:hypothetical protein n=1 Tax=Kocuria flava TaxID=446860 RepID=UPI0015DE5711|nr:hypothetical protein [Kocuria flava]